eukprot:COSAG01_NODE_10188_length_2226_cov_1.527726_3_plen_153_part_00
MSCASERRLPRLRYPAEQSPNSVLPLTTMQFSEMHTMEQPLIQAARMASAQPAAAAAAANSRCAAILCMPLCAACSQAARVLPQQDCDHLPHCCAQSLCESTGVALFLSEGQCRRRRCARGGRLVQRDAARMNQSCTAVVAAAAARTGLAAR